MKIPLIAAAFVLGSSALVLAQTATPGVDSRQANQQQRINQGVATGQLTPREANNLQRGQNRVQRIENRAKADGVVTAGERARIQRTQNRESRKIFTKKHNAR